MNSNFDKTGNMVQRYQPQTKAFRYRMVVTIETDTEPEKPLDLIKVEAPANGTVTRFLVPAEGDTIAHSFPTLATGLPANPKNECDELRRQRDLLKSALERIAYPKGRERLWLTHSVNSTVISRGALAAISQHNEV